MSTVHVVPLHDLIDHAVPGGIPAETVTKAGSDAWLSIEAVGDAEPCICDPAVEHVPSPDGGPDGWVISHSSLDGRELHE